MSLKNLANKWTKEEVKLLQDNLYSEDYEQLCELLPKRTKGGIRAKQLRLIKENEANARVNRIRNGVFKYYLEGLSEGEILSRLHEAGKNDYTIDEVSSALTQARKEMSSTMTEFAIKRSLKACKSFTVFQMRDFIELSRKDTLSVFERQKLFRTVSYG